MNNAYAAFAARRLVQALVVILLAYVFTFVVVSILPGDPITNVLRDPQNGFSEDEIRQIIAAQGLDQPVLVQLWTSLTRFLTGDFGLSMRSSRPVGTLIAEVLPSTLILASSGFAVALVLATGIAYG
ncbi:MAG: ABC transporter permease, partial [Bradyrhizobium sp.]|nr:ABC transporter permease [Bradyrhizobium sp.]